MYTFRDLQDEVKRRATKDRSGTNFDEAVKRAVNTSLFRLNREAGWRTMRRSTTFDTVTTYTTGSGGGTFTNGSKSITMTGATFITDGIKVGRRIKLQGDSRNFTIKTITGETTLTIDKNYDGTTISGTGTYSILGQEQYNLPVQAGHRTFLWHEEYGYPFMMGYVTTTDFYSRGLINTTEAVPTHYRMWNEDMVISQLLEASTVSVSSSSTSDTTGTVTVFGEVSGYPDFEEVSLNGTTAVATTKSFTTVERIVKNSSSVGRITATANSGNTTVSVLPVGDTTAGVLYKKVELWPLPNSVFPVNVYYYKDVYRLVNDSDVHEMGQEFDEAIILLATAKLNYESNKDEGDKFFGLYKDELRSLKKLNMDKIDWFPTLRGQRGRRDSLVHRNLFYSQAGANFGPSRRL